MNDKDYLKICNYIESLKNYDLYYDILDDNYAINALQNFGGIENILLESWDFVQSIGIEKCCSENLLIGDIATLLQMYYFLKNNDVMMLKLMLEIIPTINLYQTILFYDTNIHIYLFKISIFARDNDIKTAELLYKTLCGLKHPNIVFDKNITDPSRLKNMWHN